MLLLSLSALAGGIPEPDQDATRLIVVPDRVCGLEAKDRARARLRKSALDYGEAAGARAL